jgi:hypothetical protein
MRARAAIGYSRQLPISANAPVAVFGNTVLVPESGHKTPSSGGGGKPQLLAYTVPLPVRSGRPWYSARNPQATPEYNHRAHTR